MSAPVLVALALLVHRGRVLVGRRPAGTHLAGLWEFPGGKLRDGETAPAAALRELFEETGVVARALEELPTLHFAYPTRTVLLHPVLCELERGEPLPLGTLEPRWVNAPELEALEFPAANAPLVAWLSPRLDR